MTMRPRTNCFPVSSNSILLPLSAVTKRPPNLSRPPAIPLVSTIFCCRSRFSHPIRLSAFMWSATLIRAMNAMTLKRAQLPLLKTCAAIYQQHHSDEEIDEARREVIGTIERAANRSFQRMGEQQFATSLLKLAEQGDQLSVLDHTETLDHFVNTVAPLDPALLSPAICEHLPADTHVHVSIRDMHRTLVYQELASPDLYLFLTGHPGIGKTTAIARFLQERAHQGEGFLFLYISPRKQVNLDIFEKFREAPGCVNFFGLTNSLAIR